MTDSNEAKRQAALDALDEADKSTSNLQVGVLLSPHINTFRHALANCLPELPEGWIYEQIVYLTGWTEAIGSDNEWGVSIRKPGSQFITASGNSPRAAAQEAIKKIQGGGE